MRALITGGTGTIGRAVVAAFWDLREKRRKASSTHELPDLRILSRDDSKQAAMADEWRDRWPSMRFLIGDVRDLDRLRLAFRGVKWVIHAAAIKHVGACEYNPGEALATNAQGTQNVVQAAAECGVERLVLVSTDKAADPTTALGASKLMAERIVRGAASWSPTALMVARLGNVWASRGSLIDRAEAAMEAKRPLQITDEHAVRYVLTAQEAGDFILDVLRNGEPGGLYVPDMEMLTVGQMLDRAGIPADYPREFIGLQPGEKHTEQIVAASEARGIWDGKHFRIQPRRNP